MKLGKVFFGLTIACVMGICGDVVPLGQTIGKSTIDDLKKSKCPVTSQGVNKFSNGSMFTGRGNCYGIDGLEKALFIFNQSGVLEAVLLTFDKSQFQSVASSLKQKYTRKTKEVVPSVGDKYVEFEEDKVDIELKSPHMSFEMELLYITKALNAKFKQDVKSEQQQKKTQQTNKL